MKFEPSQRERKQIFDALPSNKEDLIQIIAVNSGLGEPYARSLIWNMKRLALIYTSNGTIRKV